MGQGDIAKILEDNYPNWLTFIDIQKRIDLSRNSIFRSLRQLKKRDEVQVKTEILFNNGQRQITYYRIKK